MKDRYLTSGIETLALKRKKMAFVSGPRQAGKTTLARSLLKDPTLYFSWDQLKFKQLWKTQPDKLAEEALASTHPRLVLDELHKNTQWKNELKGFYDEFGASLEILVTGSARFNTYRKGGDSLLGRFYHFHLYPFSLSEYHQERPLPLKGFQEFIQNPAPASSSPEAVKDLFQLGGFPEPLLAGSEQVHLLWQRNRLELLINQDLRELSALKDVSQVGVLAALLPLKVGSPLSIKSLQQDLGVAYSTVQRWLSFLEALYYHFTLLPYSESIARSLRKEKKLYLFDWSALENAGARFENMVALHLFKACHYWSDRGEGVVELFFLKNKEKKEVDFLVTLNQKPWFSVGAKINQVTLDSTFQVFQNQLRTPHFQIVRPSGVFRAMNGGTGKAYVMSFDSFFKQSP